MMKYVHTNIVAKDWRKLSRFYQEVFGCTPVLPERDLSGQWLEKATGIEGARIRGVHLRLPGHGENGPTIEIFQYNDQPESPETFPNRPGLGHLAFAVEDVEAVIEAVLEAGGGMVGEVVRAEIPGVGCIEFVYLTDPEGNIIEVQRT
jgi:predicted enzyme related to lactoylglutathione lyase